MQPATRNLLLAGAVAAAGVVGWTYLGPNKTGEQSDAAVVQQPSGAVLSDNTNADAPEAGSTVPTEAGSATASTANQPSAQATSQGQSDTSDQASGDAQAETSLSDGAGQTSGDETQQTASATAGTRIGVFNKDAVTDTGDSEAEPKDADAGETGQSGNRVGLQLAALPTATDDQGTEAEKDGSAESEPSAGAEDIDPKAPRIDVLRVDADGQAVLAGRAEPGKTVEIVLDGKVIATAQTDASGQFVTVVDVALTDQAQSLELRVADNSAGPETQAVAALDQEPSVRRAETGLSEPNFPNGKPKASGTDSAPATGAAPAQTAAPADSDASATLPVAGSETAAAVALSQPDTAPEAPSPADTGFATTGPEVADQTNNSPAPAATDVGERTDVAAFDPDDAPMAPDGVGGGRYRVSAPVIILPSEDGASAPALVQPNETGLALLQPTSTPVKGVVLDQISYSDAGEVRLSGRARVGKAVRIYGNGLVIGTTRVAQDGTWTMALPAELGRSLKLFRFDEIDASGKVASRIETPFEYSQLSPKVVRERRVVIQRGDMLWRIAEQFYGEGLRYSVIYGANTEQIRDPDLIYPGQVFSIPELVDAN